MTSPPTPPTGGVPRPGTDTNAIYRPDYGTGERPRPGINPANEQTTVLTPVPERTGALNRIPLNERRRWQVVAGALGLLGLILGGFTIYLWVASDRWAARADSLEDQAYDLGQRLATEQAYVVDQTEQIDILTQQLATAQQRITELADQTRAGGRRRGVRRAADPVPGRVGLARRLRVASAQSVRERAEDPGGIPGELRRLQRGGHRGVQGLGRRPVRRRAERQRRVPEGAGGLGMRRLLMAAVALALAGCASIPDLPPPLPTDFVPTPSPSASDPGPLLSPDGFDIAQRMTVRVRNVGCGFLATGTGFMIDEHTLVTNRHVIEDSSELEISTYDGHAVEATAARSTTAADIAIIRVEETLPVAAQLAGRDPQTGDAITVIGYPGGGRLTTTSGIVLGNVQDPLNGSVGIGARYHGAGRARLVRLPRAQRRRGGRGRHLREERRRAELHDSRVDPPCSSSNRSRS